MYQNFAEGDPDWDVAQASSVLFRLILGFDCRLVSYFIKTLVWKNVNKKSLLGTYNTLLYPSLQENDPFWEDPNSEVLIGTVHIYLQSLAYLIELEESLRISDFKGNEQGKRCFYFCNVQ